MKDMPSEWFADAKTSSQWDDIAAGVVSLRAEGQSLAWAVAALEDGGLGGIRKPVLAMYGTETSPEMPLAAARIVEAIPGAIEKAVLGAEHTWQPEPMAAELHLRQVLPATILSAGDHTDPSLQHRALAGRLPVVNLNLSVGRRLTETLAVLRGVRAESDWHQS